MMLFFMVAALSISLSSCIKREYFWRDYTAEVPDDAIIVDEDFFILQNPKSGLALDGSDDFVRLQKTLTSDFQQWMLEPTKNGQYYIVNKATGKLLDVDFRWPVSNTNIITGTSIADFACPENDFLRNNACQKWYVHYGGFIVNACGASAFAVDVRQLKANVKVETLGLNNGEFQEFVFQYLK